MNFSEALQGLKAGERYARDGWNGENQFIFLVPGSEFVVNREPLLGIMGEGAEVQYFAHIDMKTAAGHVTPWVPSQADMLSDDWRKVRLLGPAQVAHVADDSPAAA